MLTSGYKLVGRIAEAITSGYRVRPFPMRLLVLNNDTGILHAYEIDNTTLTENEAARLPNFRESSGIAGEGFNIWSVENFNGKAVKFDREGNNLEFIRILVDNRPEQGLAVHNNKIYVVNAGTNRRVYRYDMTTELTDDNFDVGVGNPRSIVVINDKIYISVIGSATLFAYNMDGTRDSAQDFTPTVNTDIRGLAYHDGTLFVAEMDEIRMFDFANRSTDHTFAVSLTGYEIDSLTTQYYYPVRAITSEYSLREIIAGGLTSQYGILDGIMRTITSQYGVISRLARTITSRYNVLHLLDVMKSFLSSYGLDVRAMRTVSAGYTITKRITETITSQYDLLGRILRTLTSQYSIRDLVSIIKSALSAYNLEARRSSVKTSQYDVLNDISRLLTSGYSVLGRISTMLDSGYGILAGIMRTTASQYAVLVPISSLITSQFGIIGRAIRTITSKFKLIGQIAYTNKETAELVNPIIALEATLVNPIVILEADLVNPNIILEANIIQ